MPDALLHLNLRHANGEIDADLLEQATIIAKESLPTGGSLLRFTPSRVAASALSLVLLQNRPTGNPRKCSPVDASVIHECTHILHSVHSGG